MAGSGAWRFSSRCVDVVERRQGEYQSYVLTTRPCGDRCYPVCDDWDAAIRSLGEWAQLAVPTGYEELGDGQEVYCLLRPSPEPEASLASGHECWQYGDTLAMINRAVEWAEEGLRQGEIVFVALPPLCTEVLQERLPVGHHPDLIYLDIDALLVDMMSAGGAPDRAAILDSDINILLGDLVEWGRTIRICGSLAGALVMQAVPASSFSLRCRLAAGDALKMERIISERIAELPGVSIACVTPMVAYVDWSAEEYAVLCHEHARVEHIRA